MQSKEVLSVKGDYESELLAIHESSLIICSGSDTTEIDLEREAWEIVGTFLKKFKKSHSVKCFLLVRNFDKF